MDTSVVDEVPGFNGRDEVEPSYYMTLREFPGGGFEVVTRAVRPMQAYFAAERAKHGVSGGRRRDDAGEGVEHEVSRQSNYERANRRARQRIRWLAKSMQVDRLFTLTYRENMTDRERLRHDFDLFKRQLQRNPMFKDFEFVAVAEVQKRGAYHLHLAVKGFYPVLPMLVAWQKALGGTGKERGGETLGAVNVTGCTRKWGSESNVWRSNKLAAYICKYLSETFDEHATEKKRYWQSKCITIPKPEKFFLTSQDLHSAILETVSFIRSFVSGARFDWFLTSDQTCLWVTGG